MVLNNPIGEADGNKEDIPEFSQQLQWRKDVELVVSVEEESKNVTAIEEKIKKDLEAVKSI